MGWLRWLFDYLFQCVHLRTTWPRRNRAGLTYVCCLDCGRELPYSLELMKIVGENKLHAIESKGARRLAQLGEAVASSKQSRLRPVSKASSLCCVAVLDFAALAGLVAPRPVLAVEGVSPAALQQVSPSFLNSPKVMVIGFVGGFVKRSDPRHPEVQLIRELGRQYPGAYVAVFENHNIEEAHTAIREKMQMYEARANAAANKNCPEIILFGHSWGASAVVRLARKLDRDGIPVALTVQVDSVAKPFNDDRVIPPNVAEAVNFYQTRSLIHGQRSIVAADPIHTKIIGNFRREYRIIPEPCRAFPWYSRFFTKGHIAIECDPDLWNQVKALVRTRLPSESLAENDPSITESQARAAVKPATWADLSDQKRSNNINGHSHN